MNLAKINKLSSKKILVLTAVIIFVVVIIAGLLIRLILFQKPNLLINHLPAKTELWLWQGKDGFTNKEAAILRQIGLDKTIIELLQATREEIVVYRQDGRWYKIQEQNVNRTLSPVSQNNLWAKLYKGEEDIIGFLDQGYIKNQLGVLGMDFIPILDSYYFTLQQKPNILYFSLIKKDAVFGARSVIKQPLTLAQNTILAFKLDDHALLNNILETVKKNIGDHIAFGYPVVISTQLPDRTWMKEKVIKPELFTWQEISPNTYQIDLDLNKVEEYKLEEQLTDIKSTIGYYQTDQLVIFSLNIAELSGFDFLRLFHNYSNFFYLNLVDNDVLPVVDILGKSKTLTWLHDLEINSMIVYEDNGIINGELRF